MAWKVDFLVHSQKRVPFYVPLADSQNVLDVLGQRVRDGSGWVRTGQFNWAVARCAA